MSSHNLHNTTITQHMSVLGGGAGCWFTPPAPHQLPPTAPLRQKRQPSSNHQALSVQHVMQLGGSQPMQQQYQGSGLPCNTFTPISPPGAPLSPNTQPQSMQMQHPNHHNPHLGMSNSGSVSLHSVMSSYVPMSSSAQGGLLLNSHQTTQTANGSMTTSMPGMVQQQNHNSVSMLQAQYPGQAQGPGQQAAQAQPHAGLPDISSIQQGIPQPLRGSKPAEIRPCNMPWHHGKITRERAEALLQPRSDGLFLVRESTNFPGDQTLCVCFQGRVEHYRIKCGAHSTLTIDDEEFFDTLPQLIDHYLQDADGLCTQLVKCLPKQAPPLLTSCAAPPPSTPPTSNNQLQKACQPPPPAPQPAPSQPAPPSGEHPPCLAPQAFVDAGWMIPERDLEIRENIGKGEFGDVMLGILNGQRVAVKMLKDSEAASKFLAEASLMTSLKHENLVKLLGLVFNKQHICLVTEYMSKGSLVDYLRSRGRLHVTKRDQIMFAFDTCSGMEYLEARRVVHRDLAARNVLVSDTRRAKVADFGLAREEGGPDAAAKLPIKWTAPEALKHNKFSNKSDMWSFGILLWEIYSFGRVPYPRIPLADVVKHVEKGYKMEAPEGCPPELYDLMRQAWDLNPDTRPTFSQLKAKLGQLKANTPAQ